MNSLIPNKAGLSAEYKLKYGTPEDIEGWMSLVSRISWNFPGLETAEKLDEHKAVVLRFMAKRQAICVRSGDEIAGVILFSRRLNMICCLGVSPGHRRRGIASMLMDEALRNLDRSREITVTTFRADDDKGTAPRPLYEKYGFIEEALIEELGYPSQRYVLYPAGSERGKRQNAINRMTIAVAGILTGCGASVYLYGSSVLDDFRLGWSDIDILVLTQKQITEEQARRLVGLRQELLESEPDSPYYRSFEGGMLTLNAFLTGEKDRVVYWGTSGERIIDKYEFDSFCMSELTDSGMLVYGNDIRSSLPRPAYDALRSDVQRHFETIRGYARTTGRSLYSFGWLLDISRCIYTLRTGKIISKTAAGEWALREKLCPCARELSKAVAVRKEPLKYKDSRHTLDLAETLGEQIQRYADVLENELKLSDIV